MVANVTQTGLYASAAVRLIRFAGRDRLWFAVLAIAVTIYAFLAGLRLAGSDDLFFLLNDARWLVEHGEVPWTDHYSFTAQGAPWIYPIGGGLLFYGLWVIGGFAAISYFAAAVTAATVALTLRWGSVISAVLAAIMTPLIASRTGTRADLFSTVLMSAFVAILWRYHTASRARLWLLPVLMIVWVNTHLGFFVGLGLLGIYVGLELLELISGPSTGAVERLRRAWPRFALTFVVTPINPYSAWIYDGIRRQLVAGPWLVQSGEWGSVPMPNWATLSRMLTPGDPSGEIYLALTITLTLLAIALWRRQFSAAAFLACAAALAVEHSRLGAFLGIIIVVVGPTVLERHTVTVRFWPKTHSSRAPLSALTATAFIIALAYLRLTTWPDAGGSLFEAGLSREFADGAISFIARERLPGNVLPFEHGAYFTWRLWPKYLDYTDSRSIPFVQADALLDYLLRQPPNALVWQRVAEHYGISALLASGDVFDQYRQFCVSDTWPPVYIDQHAVIFVRRTADTEELIKRLRVDCASARLPAIAPQSVGARDEWLAAAQMLQNLERYDEALAAAQQALAIAPASSRAHLVAEAAQGVIAETNRPALSADRKFRARLHPSAISAPSPVKVCDENGFFSKGVLAPTPGREAKSMAITEDTLLIRQAMAYVIELYREMTGENGAPTLGTQNQVVDYILAEPALCRAVSDWARTVEIDEAMTKATTRLPRDDAYRRISACLQSAIEPSVFFRPGQPPR